MKVKIINEMHFNICLQHAEISFFVNKNKTIFFGSYFNKDSYICFLRDNDHVTCPTLKLKTISKEYKR